jgi:hypothetical protein
MIPLLRALAAVTVLLSATSCETWENRTPTEKKAILGGAGGAAVGAAVSDRKGVGAVVGGAVGAAGGYLFGKHQEGEL